MATNEQTTNGLTPKLVMHPQEKSRLFKLPPELRNRIYEPASSNEVESIDLASAFAHERDEDPYSDLAVAVPPSSTLMRSCQKIWQESKGIFATLFQAYWDKEFVVNMCEDPLELKIYIRHIPNAYLSRINNFKFLLVGPVSPDGYEEKIEMRWAWDGRWTTEVVALPHPVVSYSSNVAPGIMTLVTAKLPIATCLCTLVFLLRASASRRTQPPIRLPLALFVYQVLPCCHGLFELRVKHFASPRHPNDIGDAFANGHDRGE